MKKMSLWRHFAAGFSLLSHLLILPLPLFSPSVYEALWILRSMLVVAVLVGEIIFAIKKAEQPLAFIIAFISLILLLLELFLLFTVTV